MHFNNCLIESCVSLYFVCYTYILILLLKHNLKIKHQLFRFVIGNSGAG
jgi:hypothetical protein